LLVCFYSGVDDKSVNVTTTPTAHLKIYSSSNTDISGGNNASIASLKTKPIFHLCGDGHFYWWKKREYTQQRFTIRLPSSSSWWHVCSFLCVLRFPSPTKL